MTAERIGWLEKSGRFYFMRIEGPVETEKIGEIPKPEYYGGNGREAVEPRVHDLDDATIIGVQSWVFGRDDEKFVAYAQTVAETLGDITCSKSVQLV